MTALALIFVPVLLVWAVAVWHLSDPAHRAEAMPAPPSEFAVAVRVMTAGIRRMHATLMLELMPITRTAVEAMKAFEESLARLRVTLASTPRTRAAESRSSTVRPTPYT